MFFYYALFALIGFFSLIEVIGVKVRQDRIIFLFLSGLLCILSFIRWECGTDWQSYYLFFTNLPDIGDKSNFELGFHLLNYLGKIFFNSYTGFLFLFAVLLFGLQTFAINKLSILPVTSLFILFSSSFANVFFIRQSLATVILFFSVIYIIKRNKFKFLLCIIFATLIHYSSVIFLPAWWLFYWSPSKKKLIIIFLIALFFSTAVSLLLQHIGDFIGGIVQYKLSYYLNNNGEDSLQGSNYSLTIMLVKGLGNKALILFPAIALLDSLKNKFINYSGFLNLYWMGVIIYFITSPISLVLVRFSFAYEMFSILLIPLMLSKYKLNIRISLFCVLIVYLAMRLYVAINSYYDLFVPYRTIFN